MNFLDSLLTQFGGSSELAYRDWYASLEKPFFAPPEWLFGVAWGVIYPLIIFAFLWTLAKWRKGELSGAFVLVFVANIITNLLFTPLLLVTRNNTVGFVSILAVLGTLLLLQVWAWKRSKVVFWALTPYLLWGSFATVLQAAVLLLNA